MAETVTLAALHAANIARQAEWCPDQVTDLSFRGNELGGECGEAQNVIKKLERERHGWAGSRATKEQLAEELADVVICADLCAVTAGIDLGAAVVAKFNATSGKVGLATRLAGAPHVPTLEAGIRMGIEAAIRGIDATILNQGSECDRRGIQDPETGEVPCDGEEETGCACSTALELGARLIKNLRSCDVEKIAALATREAARG